jgi:hypothetical protein
MVVLALAVLAAGGPSGVTSLAHRQLGAGQQFEIETIDHVYRGQLINHATGECQMAISSDGQSFAPSRTVYLLGATAGPQARQTFVLMHEVKVGLKMELGMDDLEQQHRLITSEVRAIRLRR